MPLDGFRSTSLMFMDHQLQQQCWIVGRTAATGVQLEGRRQIKELFVNDPAELPYRTVRLNLFIQREPFGTGLVPGRFLKTTR